MTRQQFDFEFGRKQGLSTFDLIDDWIVFRNGKHGVELYNEKTEESIIFKDIDEFLNHKLDDVTVWDIIEKKETIKKIYLI